MRFKFFPHNLLKPSTRNFLLVFFSFVVASVINVYPLSVNTSLFRPMALMMVLIFWVIRIPRHVGVFTAFSVGLVSDLLMDTRLGQQAFCAVIMVFGLQLALGYLKRMTAFKAWGLAQFALLVFQISLWLVQYITQNIFIASSGISLLTSMLLWLPLYGVLIRLIK